MAMRDPNFWTRISTAMHQDAPNPKDSNIDTSLPSPPPVTPLSQYQISTPSAPISPLFTPSSLPLAILAMPACASPLGREKAWEDETKPAAEIKTVTEIKTETQTTHAHRNSSMSNLSTTPALPQQPRPKNPAKLKKSASRASSTRPLLHQRNTSHPSFDLPLPAPAFHPQTQTRPTSFLLSPSISLSGRPRTIFKTWTTITGAADAASPDSASWVAGQNRKKRRRMWIWMGSGLGAVVVTVLVVVLVLWRKGILG